MTYKPFLARIRQLFTSAQGEHLDRIEDAFSTGLLHVPARPMSDQELARAIREFRTSPVSDWTVQKLKKRLADAPRPRGEKPV